jgi:hypothetical protein
MQRTRITPLRLTTLQLRQIFFTDARTFILYSVTQLARSNDRLLS